MKVDHELIGPHDAVAAFCKFAAVVCMQAKRVVSTI